MKDNSLNSCMDYEKTIPWTAGWRMKRNDNGKNRFSMLVDFVRLYISLNVLFNVEI